MSVLECDYIVNNSGSIVVDVVSFVKHPTIIGPQILNVTFGGPCTASTSLTITQVGRLVYVTIQPQFGTSLGSSFFTSSVGIIPVIYRPTTTRSAQIIVMNNSVRAYGSVSISTLGTLTIRNYTSSFGGFSNGGIVGWDKTTFSWAL
jgi:hypothetical protein